MDMARDSFVMMVGPEVREQTESLPGSDNLSNFFEWSSTQKNLPVLKHLIFTATITNISVPNELYGDWLLT